MNTVIIYFFILYILYKIPGPINREIIAANVDITWRIYDLLSFSDSITYFKVGSGYLVSSKMLGISE